MDFLNGLGKKISQTGQNAVQKTKDIAEIARLNSLITTEEEKIGQAYFEVGKQYVEMFGTTPIDEFASMVNSIRESEKYVDILRQQIQDIKGLLRCEKCGTELVKGALFCSSCGFAVPNLPNEDVVECSNCKSIVKSEMKFCTSCGNPMAVEDVEGICVGSNRIEERMCSNCGTVVADDVDFCIECGTKI